ncbi:hypothetical protein [Methylophilus luteus]|uniref:Uncharacterized protein n=1 Tax=Methylophilus luteus TaxID=640108 RepID=A0ABW3F265_9PROT
MAMFYGGGKMLLLEHWLIFSCCFCSSAPENICSAKRLNDWLTAGRNMPAAGLQPQAIKAVEEGG